MTQKLAKVNITFESLKNSHLIPESVELNVPFEFLVEVIKGMNLKDKKRLSKLIEEQIDLDEDEIELQNPRIQAEIREARAAYEAGDYITIEEYLAQREKKAK